MATKTPRAPRNKSNAEVIDELKAIAAELPRHEYGDPELTAGVFTFDEVTQITPEQVQDLLAGEEVTITNENPEVTITHALSAFGPNGEVLAQSWDGGVTWKKTEAGKKQDQRSDVPRTFTRRVTAVVDVYTPSTARRIETPFTRLHEIGVLAGVMPFAEAIKMEDRQLDGIICPGLIPQEQLDQLKRVSRSIMLDLDAPLVWSEESRTLLYDTIAGYDAVIVPTPQLASRILPYHKRVFVSPHLLREDLWAGVKREMHERVVFGIPTSWDSIMGEVISAMRRLYGESIEFVPYEWYTMLPGDEALTYPGFDVVILPPPHDRYQASWAPVLPAMAAGCTIVADRHWPGIRHNENGLIINRNGSQQWLNELRKTMDTRLRMRLGKNAKATAHRQSTITHRAQIFMPYRVVVPEGTPQSFA